MKKKRNSFVDKEWCVQVRGFQSRGKTKRDINRQLRGEKMIARSEDKLTLHRLRL